MGPETSPRRPLTAVAVAAAGAIATACGGAPSITAFGAYFPSWLLCLVFCALLSLGAHVVLVRTGLAPFVPMQLAFCLSIGVIGAVLLSLLWIGS